MWQLRMHCNLRPPVVRATPALSPLITTPCQVWRRRNYPLPYYSVFAANTLFYAVTLTFDLWPLTFNIFSVSTMTWWNSVPNLNAIKQSAGELLRCQCLTLWPWTWFECCARLWDNFHQVWPSTTYPCLNYSVFMMVRFVKLWPWPLTCWPWKFVVHQMSRDQSLYEIWAKSSTPRLNYW